jgi:hypothetical protein
LYTVPILSSYIVGGIVAALAVINVSNVSDSPADSMQGQQYLRSEPQSFVEAASSKMQVDRSHKSDRLPVMRTDPMTNTSSIQKDANTPAHATPTASGIPAWPATLGTTAAPAPLLYCETLASPNSDPIFGHIVGRCLV